MNTTMDITYTPISPGEELELQCQVASAAEPVFAPFPESAVIGYMATMLALRLRNDENAYLRGVVIDYFAKNLHR